MTPLVDSPAAEDSSGIGDSESESDLASNDSEDFLISDDMVDEASKAASDNSRQQQPKRRLNSIREPQFIYPLSKYEGYEPPFSISSEQSVVSTFLSILNEECDRLRGGNCGADYIEFDITDFSIYRAEDAGRNVGGEMSELQYLPIKNPGNASKPWYFDGVLTFRGAKRYVQAVPFKLCSVGNYEEEFCTVGGEIWIQSVLNKDTDVYYIQVDDSLTRMLSISCGFHLVGRSRKALRRLLAACLSTKRSCINSSFPIQILQLVGLKIRPRSRISELVFRVQPKRLSLAHFC